MCVCVCVCVCETERERVCVCVERETVRQRWGGRCLFSLTERNLEVFTLIEKSHYILS